MTTIGKTIVRELGTWLAEQLGIDPKDTQDMEIHLPMNDIAHIHVRLLLNDSEYGGKLISELKRYDLKERS